MAGLGAGEAAALGNVDSGYVKQNKGNVHHRSGYPAPSSAMAMDVKFPANRAKSFHGISDLKGSALFEEQRQDPGSTEDAGGAVVNPWGSNTNTHGGNSTSKDFQSSSWSHPQGTEHINGDVAFESGRQGISFYGHPQGHGTKPNAKGKGKARDAPRLSLPPCCASTHTVGAGLDGHPNVSIGGLGWDALETGERWNARSLRRGETPLDRTIDQIGVGRYQKTLLLLSGLGYLADNMWLQGIAIVLPRVQDEWDVPDQWIGLLSSSTFAGMMVGALAWGSYSDSYGRKDAFNGTLFVTAIFGCLSSFATSFPMLCFLTFLLGTGVGGSMPTDGTLFLENLPKSKQYLLTALSVFFALGSVITSLLGLAIIPENSCPEDTDWNPAVQCDTQTQNQGWRWLLNGLGFVTVCFVIARLIFFKLFESPKFLVASGRHQEARVVLQQIAAFNGKPLPVSLRDVEDEQRRHAGSAQRDSRPFRGFSSLFGGDGKANSPGYDALPTEDEEHGRSEMEEATPSQSLDRPSIEAAQATTSSMHILSPAAPLPLPLSPPPAFVRRLLPANWHTGLADFWARYTHLFEPHWRRTTILVWAIWTLVSLAFTIFNVFLPKFLEARLGAGGRGNGGTPNAAPGSDGGLQSRKDVMQDYLLYALASVPGSLLGAWMIETRLGRIGSMALSTACTGVSIAIFTVVRSRGGIVLSSMLISISATTTYAAIYGYTPEVFTTDVRGTACGSASALSRLAGIVAPLAAGVLIAIDINLPLFLSIALFAVCVGCMLALPYETRRRPDADVDADADIDAAIGVQGDAEVGINAGGH
ncbi:MFS general substrate transporter [Tilletiaria anomala UBC 951]|uniref:MFS general substrate transporter n=1 Tax=Tilletiaria anomala (strain ATCC 24038 / CBS 436.72 / UBC 951) TaxID=1037660 RepID=A0A066WPN2_TILAU|nr:MFS general substrate transporter [Tilletiaria anomala UBC 951]KDN52949.1 MFS general substrate transporter [Tilletiaria anomala UBC 951]